LKTQRDGSCQSQIDLTKLLFHILINFRKQQRSVKFEEMHYFFSRGLSVKSVEL